MNTIQVRLCSKDDKATPRLNLVVDLVNTVYADAERGMWPENFRRTSHHEIGYMIDAGDLLLALDEGKVIGCVMVRKLTDKQGEFGMLVCHPDYRNKGIGSRLIRTAEERCRALGCSEIRLELLYPKDWKQNTKEILKAWYPKLGYEPGPQEDFKVLYPKLAPFLATDCYFQIFTKTL